MKRLIWVALVALGLVAVIRPRGSAGVSSAVGRLLRGLRSGDARSAGNDPQLRTLPTFELSSDAFADGAPMPEPYVDAAARQPPLCWSGLPDGTAELALIVEDVDVPLRAPLVHAIAYGIDPAKGCLEAGAIPRIGHPQEGDPSIGLGAGAGGRHFLPPTPIPGHGPHRNVFEAFALRAPLRFDRPPNKTRLVNALRETAIARGVIVGTHERP